MREEGRKKEKQTSNSPLSGSKPTCAVCRKFAGSDKVKLSGIFGLEVFDVKSFIDLFNKFLFFLAEASSIFASTFFLIFFQIDKNVNKI